MCQLLNSVDGTLSLLNKLTFYAFPTKTSEFLHPKSSPYLGNKTAKRWRFRGVRSLSLQGSLPFSENKK
jgi:phosphoglycerate kinase